MCSRFAATLREDCHPSGLPLGMKAPIRFSLRDSFCVGSLKVCAPGWSWTLADSITRAGRKNKKTVLTIFVISLAFCAVATQREPADPPFWGQFVWPGPTVTFGLLLPFHAAFVQHPTFVAAVSLLVNALIYTGLLYFILLVLVPLARTMSADRHD
jgi:hypothetical protein